MFSLTVDDRERALFAHLDGKCTYKVSRLKIGDYAVFRANQLFALFERKTLEDYGASIKDGRLDNREKLFVAREKTGCKLFYIIEGWGPKSRTTTHAGIPFKSIEASLFHQMVRDNIMVIYTADAAETAQALTNFLASMETLEKAAKKLPEKVGLTESQQNGPMQNEGPKFASSEIPGLDPAEAAQIITTGPPKDPKALIAKLWEVIPTVGPVNGRQIAEMGNFTIKDWLSGNIKPEQLDSIKFPSGRGLSAPIKDRLMSKEITHTIAVDILAAIPLISQKVAFEICKNYWPLVKIFDESPEKLAKMKLQMNNKPLGGKRAKNIYDMLGPPNPPSPTSATQMLG